MSELATPSRPQRPEFRNIHALKDLPSYRLPPAGWVSILHRVSGALMFLLLPFIIWMFDTSLTSEYSFARFSAAFSGGITFVPGWLIKLVALALIWAYLHHIIAGLRHLMMDMHIGLIKPKETDTIKTIWAETKAKNKDEGGGTWRAIKRVATHIVSPNRTAKTVLVSSLGLTVVLGAKLFGLY